MAATVSQLDEFDEIIDARTPKEFAEDRISGARNFPVLYDEERVKVGTLYKQVSAFEAKKVGAALVARNIADHLERHFADRPRNWRPLVYCWRGGNRSGSLVTILRAVGWKAEQLEGGYKAYRRMVLAELETLPARFGYRVVCGATGSGKSELLRALLRQGGQVLDLEGLAAHRGSVLGSHPDTPQPSQKRFDSLLWDTLRRFDPERPVYVEAESKKIGNLRAPDALMSAMWSSPCLRMEVPMAARVDYLQRDYRHYLEEPETLCEKLAYLTALHGKERIGRWQELTRAGAWNELVEELLVDHYDPAYRRSTRQHYPQLEQSPPWTVDAINDDAMDELARRILAEEKL
ncbi:MAG: tRNA 2-selenouridine(34) synthase MnmH [Sulfuricellaceae bacterium]|jgi:tRNA 2-selenouridine synthase